MNYTISGLHFFQLLYFQPSYIHATRRHLRMHSLMEPKYFEVDRAETRAVSIYFCHLARFSVPCASKIDDLKFAMSEMTNQKLVVEFTEENISEFAVFH